MSISTVAAKVLTKIGAYILPNELNAKATGYTKDQIAAMSERKSISELIFHRTYIEEEDSRFGFYIMGDGRIGVMFEVTPPPYLSTSSEDLIISSLSLIVDDDTIVHINAYAGQNIEKTLNSFKNSQVKNKKINLGHPELLDDLVDNKIDYFHRWKSESIMGKDSDMRVRTFTNIVSILFPNSCTDESIKMQCNQILGSLKSINARNMPPSKLIPLIKEFIDPEEGNYIDSNDTTTSINKQMTSGARIRCDDANGLLHMGENETWKASVLTVDKYAPEVDLFTFQNAFFDAMGNDVQMIIPGPFVLSLTIRFTNVKKRRKEVLSKARHNYGQTASLGIKIEKKFPRIKDIKDECTAIINHCQNGEFIVDAFLCLTLFEKTKEKLDSTIGAVKKSFESIPGRMLWKEERFSPVANLCMLQSIPLNYSELIHANLKKMSLHFKSNNGQVAPLISGFKGLGSNATHLYMDRTGQIIPIDYFASTGNYNICIVGPQGSGKSMFANDLHSMGMKSAWDIRMIDFGRSYEKFSKTIGGQFIEFPKKNKRCVNFFTFIATEFISIDGKEEERIHPDEFDTIVPIVGLMLGLELKNIYKLKETTPSEKRELTVITRYIIKAIEYAFKISGKSAGMREVSYGLLEFKNKLIDIDGESKHSVNATQINLLAELIIGLENYSIDGASYFKYFNGPNNINLNSKHIIVELDDIKDSPVMPVIAMGILQRMAQEAFLKYLEDKSTSRLIGVDEAWVIMDSPLFMSFFEDFARRIRKYRGLTVLISQTIEEFFQSASSTVIFNTASFQIFLPQQAEMIDSAITNKRLRLNKFQINLMKSVKSKTPHYNEFIMKHSGSFFVGLLQLTPDEYWTYTSNPNDRHAVDMVMENKKLELSDAIWYLARSSEGIAEEEIKNLLKIRKSNKGIKIDWEDFFNVAIKENTVAVARQYINKLSLNNEKSVIGKELLIRIIYEGNTYSSNFFIEEARRRNFGIAISKIFFKKCIDYILTIQSDNKITINLSLEEITNKSFMKYLNSQLEILGDKKSKIIFDVKFDYKIKNSVNHLLEFIDEMSILDIRVSLDNVDFAHLDIETLSLIEPYEFKVNINEIKKLIKNGRNDYSTALIKGFFESQSKWVNIILVQIEDEEDEKLAIEFGVNTVQGFYYDKPEII